MKRKKKATILLSVLAAVIVTFLLLILLFRVKNVDVTGNHHISDEEIESRLIGGPLTGNTIFMSLFMRHPDFSDNAFVERVSVKYVDRNSLRIEVEEKPLIGYVAAEGSYWYFNQNGEVLVNSSVPEAGDEEAAQDTGTVEPYYIPLIKGLSVTEPVLGEVLPVSDPSVFSALGSLTEIINKRDIDPAYVTFNTDGTMTMMVGSIEVLLGEDEHLEEKLEELSGILPEAEGLSGTLHLENFDGSQKRIILDTK